MAIWKDNFDSEPLKINGPTADAKPMTESEWQAIVDRLDVTRDIFRQNRELQEVLSLREAENRTLQGRNTELEDVMRRFAPMVLNAATAMGLMAKNEKPGAKP